MNKSKKERLKFCLLIVLIISSLLQVGILLNYQNYSISTNFLWSFIENENKDFSEYFRPYKIIISEGFDESHWVIYTTNELYEVLWKDAKSYLKEIFETNKTILYHNKFQENEWGDLVVKKSIIFEFKTPISANLLKGFFSIKTLSSKRPLGIYKMILLPAENVNDNLTLYIYDKNTIYKYEPKIHHNGINKHGYDDIIKKFKSDITQVSYNIVKEFIPNNNRNYLNLRLDMPVIIKKNKYKRIYSINALIPNILNANYFNKNEDLLEFSKKILGNKSESFELGMDSNKLIVFKNLNNIYRIYKNGLFEYRYIYDFEESSNVDEFYAFQKAIEFIENKSYFLKDMQIFLSDIKYESLHNYYTFKFNYIVNEIPIFIDNYESKTEHTKVLDSAITINANNNRVIDCWWILREFNILKRKNELYDIGNFQNILTYAYERNKSVIKNFYSVNDINISYKMNIDKDIFGLDLVWIINIGNNNNIIVPLDKKKGSN